MKSHAIQFESGRADLGERLASVLQSSRTIRSEVALTICESSEMRLASRQLRIDSLRTFQRSAARRRDLATANAERNRWIARAIVHVLSSRGYPAFVAAPPRDTASHQ
jgi:hypothetical protein